MLQVLRRYKYSLPLLVGLNLADMVTTFIGLAAGGVELNPLAGYFGMPTFMIVKFMIPLLIGIELAYRPKVNASKTLWVCCGLMGIVLINNLAHVVMYYSVV